ncbi:RxLR effector protein [Phytophthora megakarya]|uniref:RxLR effector protein n=1 Tax=Phytophthora megakarya TaxID=4795 RepID=A0A225VDQ4_9STRA|nr:RxLR effector protein [Phytophthora megakarya]
MRFSFLLIAATFDAIRAMDSTVATIEADTNPTSIDAGSTERYLRQQKWIEDDDTTHSTKNEERTGTELLVTIEDKCAQWLNAGLSPGEVTRHELPNQGYSSTELKKFGDAYAKIYRIKYGLDNGRPFTE